jgi:dihydrofolate reductase
LVYQRKEAAMRDLILKMSISIDGFVGRPDGSLRWIFDGDQEAIAWTVETVWNAGLHIMGSHTFRDMAAYWPTSTEVFAPPMNQIPKAVFSRQGAAILKAGDTTAALKDARARAREQPNHGVATRC